MATLVDGHWLTAQRADPRAFGLYQRHYSSAKNAPSRSGRTANFVGPGQPLVLLTEPCNALFVWLKNQTERYDRQEGVCCTVFRNEGPVLSSELIREADDLAWARWPGERHFTYVEDAQVRSTNPGYCFKQADWRTCGRNKDGRLTILERLP